MQRVVVLNIAGLSAKLAGNREAAPTISSMTGARPLKPCFPAVTCTVQATYMTGAPPSEHGIIANGLYDRDYMQVRFWEQSNKLVQSRKIWETARERNPDFTSALLFWQHSMGAAVDVLITPAPVHKHDGGMISSCYSKPTTLYDELAAELGQFNLMSYWGPMASFASSRWIASAARRVFEKFKPHLTMVYLPHLDYPLQRLGPDDPKIIDEMKQTDELVSEIKQWTEAAGARLLVLSEYAITNVSRAVTPNRILRDAGLLEVRTVEGIELLDIPASKAFAMVDHQVAHVYATPSHLNAARDALAGADGIDFILDSQGKAEYGVDHPRAGDLVAVAKPDNWFAYYWWHDNAKAPDFAHSVDIHRKPGYDPGELFIEPATRTISLDTSRVKGSHGRPADDANMAFFAGTDDAPDEPNAADAAGIILKMLEI